MEYTNMKALFMIVNAGFSDDVIEIAREEGAKGATIMNARGEGERHESFMGITLDSEKEVIVFLVDENAAGKIMTAVKNKIGVKTPAHSVCFMLPVDKIIGLSWPKLTADPNP